VATNEQIQEVEDQFFAAVPEALAFRTDNNLDILYNFILGAWGTHALTNVSAWEIAFKSCKLKKIAGWIAPITDEQRELVNVPAHVAREKYKTDPEFKAAWDAIAQADKDRQELLNWARTYQTIDPEEVARRTAEEPGFAEAVQKLVDEGLI
jgi:hypothetical protein